MEGKTMSRTSMCFGLLAVFVAVTVTSMPAAAQKKPNVVMLMTDDTGWNDFGAYTGGGAALGHPTPNIDRIAKEGVMFTSWYGQASCTAGRASFMTGRIPIRSVLSIVVAPGDENALRKETPTIAEFFQKNGYSTYFSGKWHLGDKPAAYPIEHGFDEMKLFAAYYPGVYTYPDTSKWFHPWFPSYNAEFAKEYFDVVNMYAWDGEAGKPARRGEYITYDNLATFDVRQTDYAIEYIKKHAKDDKPFFMDVNFMKMHNPTNAAPKFAGKSRLGDYSDSVMELDDNIGRIMDAIRAEAPNTIVIVTADNGAWQDAYPDAGTTPFRGEKGSAFEGGWRVPGLMWWPGHIPAGAVHHEMMSHIDCWATLAKWSGLRHRRTARGRTTTASRSTSTASTTALTSSGRQSILPGDRGSTSMAKASWERAWTSAVIQTTPISTSRGNICGRPRTRGSGWSRTWARSARFTTSPWTRSRNTI
jgi:arylsulfatase A-like enzyme